MKIESGSLPVQQLQELMGGRGTLQLVELMDREILRGAGRRVGLMTIPPQCSIGVHQHQGECEAYYVLAGEGLYQDNEQEYSIFAGDFVLCKDGDSHGVINKGETDLCLFILILNTIA